MKIRLSLVSNSSSSSFIIQKANLTNVQQFILCNLIDYLKIINYSYCTKDVEDWLIEDNGDHISCSTDMNNFDLVDFLETHLNIPITVLEEYS